MKSFVYRWTDHKTGMLYIGSHKGTIDDGYICTSNLVMEQYNERPEDFTREILREFENYNDAHDYETQLLVEVDARNNPLYYNGHNNSKTFFNKGHTEETKQKISVSNKGKKRTEEFKNTIRLLHKGRILTTERKQQISKQMMGEGNPFFGKKHTDNTKQKISNNHRKPWLGKSLSEEHKEKIRLSRLGKKFPRHG